MGTRKPAGSYTVMLLEADRDAAVAVLTDPDLIRLLALERTVCTPVEDAAEIMSLAVNGVSYSNQTVYCDDAPIVAARAILNELVEDYFPVPPPRSDEPVLVSGGWSFGFCGGQCVGNLAVDGAGLRYTITGHLPEDPVYLDNAGTLTAAGVEALQSAQAPLASEAIDEVYGCPDCADGGASHVILSRDGEIMETSKHTYEFGNPPAVLAELDALIRDLMAALESCKANQLVEISPDCTPRAED